ncbi:MAG: c-type cytochrome [Geminicoccaceae bacterium]
MFSSKPLSVITVLASLAFSAGAGLAGPDLGEEISADDLAAWDISIAPDGSGLPAGSGSVTAGADLYAKKCAQCHGETGTEGPADPIAGGTGSLASEAPAKTVGSFWPYATTLFDYTRRAMPFDAPQSLSADEVYALTAYVLHLNGIVEADAVIDAASLAAIEMPNRDGFVAHWPEVPK